MDFSKYLNFKSVLFGLGLFATVIAVLGFSGKIPFFNSSSSNQKLTGTVKVWGTLSQEGMSNFVSAFNKEAKTYSMQYTEVPYNQFNNKLTSALADGVGPDLIIGPVDLALANISRLFPINTTTIPESVYKNSFIDSAAILIYPPYGYIALPVSIDPLVLYYNKDILSSNGFLYPPTTWGDLYTYERKITKKDDSQNISLSTIAFGTYDNIPHVTDIILSMIFQQGQIPVVKSIARDSDGNSISKYTILVDQSITDDGNSPLNSALAFTKDFSDTQKDTYNWNPKSGDALSKFISGNLAFYIGYASESYYVKSANQKLSFDYTYLPQADGSKISATYGKLNTIFMLRTSPNASETSLAYQIMIALATGPFSQNLVSTTGAVSALKANIAEEISSGGQDAEIFGNSALISKTFYDLHRQDLESLMREAIREVYNGEKSTVEASKEFTDNLQAVYDGE
ncbi:MAG: carbohydrate ABC transporter substrate-binding protein [Candidatus Pacebacteria bacterium]|nr:carbohydrate ABC transporter substrate-binding protein [Candidatus Paceibacterota bacterium]